jgi:hypothetical protein
MPVLHATPADNTFSAEGSNAWNEAHSLTGKLAELDSGDTSDLILTRPIIGSTTWANRPAAATYPNAILRVSDVGVAGSLWMSDGVVWKGIQPGLQLFYENINLGNGANTDWFKNTTYTMPDLLGTDGDRLEFTGQMVMSAAVSTKSYAVNIGFTSWSAAAGFTGGISVIANGTTNASVTFEFRGVITRLGATSAGYFALNQISSGSAQNTQYTTASPDWSAAQPIAFTARDGTGNAAAVTAREFSIRLWPR